MDSSKKHSSSDRILPSSNKVITRFGLGIVASLIVLTLLFFSNSLKTPLVVPLFRGFYSAGAGSSPASWRFSFSSLSSSSATNATGSTQVETIQEVNASMVAQMQDFEGANGQGIVLGNTHLGNFSQEVTHETSGVEGGIEPNTHQANGSVIAKNGSLVASDEKTQTVNDNRFGNFSEITNNGTLLVATEDANAKGKTEGKSAESSPDGDNTIAVNNNGGNFTSREKVGEYETTTNASYQADSLEKNPTDTNISSCDIFDGRWVRDDSKPYYPAGSCPYIDRDFDCHLNGRPDDGFAKWKWQPNGCDIPRFNATDFLEKLRGKKLVFVGDSLNRNMWESLVCLLRHSVENKERVYEISGRKEFKKKGFYAFRFEDYDCSVDFVAAPFLVRESVFKGKNGSIETLRLDLMDRTTSMYQDADIIVFNTGHWWTHEKTSRGEDYYQEGNHVYPRLKVLEAYKKALTTWARWVDKNIDNSRTQIIFRGYSVTHFRGGPWNLGGQCHKETDPFFNVKYLAKYPSKMRALEPVLREMKVPVIYMNISRLTDFRKDGHPSVYRSTFKSIEEQKTPEKFQDCSHWCLPGVPDTWNELLYASLLKAGRGSWKI